MTCERLASRSIDIGDRTLFERCFSFEALLDFVCEWSFLRLALGFQIFELVSTVDGIITSFPFPPVSFGRRPTGSKTQGLISNSVAIMAQYLCGLRSPIPGAPCCHTVNLIYIDPHCLDSGKELRIARAETRQQQRACEYAGIFPSVRLKISISLTSIVDGDFVRGV